MTPSLFPGLNVKFKGLSVLLKFFGLNARGAMFRVFAGSMLIIYARAIGSVIESIKPMGSGTSLWGSSRERDGLLKTTGTSANEDGLTPLET